MGPAEHGVSIFPLLLILLAVVLVAWALARRRPAESYGRPRARRGRVVVGVVLALILLCPILLVPIAHYRKGEMDRRKEAVREEAARVGMESGVQLTRVSTNTYRFHIPDQLEEWNRVNAVEGLASSPEMAKKSWVTDAAGSQPLSTTDGAIRGRSPGPQGELVGYSDLLEPRLELARVSADRSARDQLKALLLSEVKDPRGPPLADVSPLAERLIDRAFTGLVRDRFDQEIRRPYGTLYRSAVLVRADKQETIRPMVEQLRRDIQSGEVEKLRRRRELLHTIASALGLGLVIFFVYSFLNAGTKGHFAWSLRVLSVGAFGLICLAILYLRGFLG